MLSDGSMNMLPQEWIDKYYTADADVAGEGRAVACVQIQLDGAG